MKRLLIKFSHGLGDAVQLTIVLRHLQRHWPDWQVDVVSKIGKHTALRGLCHSTYHEGAGRPAEAAYDLVKDLGWWEHGATETILPSTKPVRCLREDFHIEPDADLFRYPMLAPTPEELQRAEVFLAAVTGGRMVGGRYPVMAIHYEGNTAAANKNLSLDQAVALCHWAVSRDLVPLVLDWDRRSDHLLARCRQAVRPALGTGDLWGDTGTGDAAMLAAMFSRIALVAAIDSGPLHVAGMTATPTIAVWTAHEPWRYFDLSDQVLHVLPEAMLAGAPEFFRRHYRHLGYESLMETLLFTAGDQQLNHQAATGDSLRKIGGFWVRPQFVEQDFVIVRDIYEEDAYRTRLLQGWHKEDPDYVVVDVGAHIGTFARLWHDKVNSQAKIICVEACPENLPALRANVGEFAEVVHAACTYEGGPMALLNTVTAERCLSTGGSTVVPATGLRATPGYRCDDRPLEKITLEQVMERFGLKKIDLLKLDCEGSEFSILENCDLSKVRFVLGEYHGWGRFQDLLRRRFRDWDFGHMSQCPVTLLGNFHLDNRVFGGIRRDRRERLRIGVPSGIGDALWALTKVPWLRSLHGAAHVEIVVCNRPPLRSADFLRGFDFVDAVGYEPLDILHSEQTTDSGRWNYLPTQQDWHGLDWLLIPNGHLEDGGRLEEWLPAAETDWGICQRYRYRESALQRAEALLADGPYVVTFLGNRAGNTSAGHNRNALWSRDDWVKLWSRMHAAGYRVIVVGAEYDRDYSAVVLDEAGRPDWIIDAVGQWAIDETLAVIRRAAGVIAYQSGLGVFAAFLGVPTAMWWRPHGDSLFADRHVTFREPMASAWVPPQACYLPLIYGRQNAEQTATQFLNLVQGGTSHEVVSRTLS